MDLVTKKHLQLSAGRSHPELARQVANAAPSHLVLLGHGENSLFEAEARLRIDFAMQQHELFFSAVEGSDLSLQLA